MVVYKKKAMASVVVAGARGVYVVLPKTDVELEG